MSEYVQKFKDFTASANPDVSEKRKVTREGNYKLVKKTSKDPNKDSYKLVSKKGAELTKPDGHLTDDVFVFLKKELGEKLYKNAKAELKKIKDKKRRDVITFDVHRVDKKSATEEDIKKTTRKETKEEPKENILTVEEPIAVGTKKEPVAKIKQEIVDKFKNVKVISNLEEFKKTDEYSDSNKHDDNSGEIIKILKIGYGTPADKATTDIDKDIVDKIVAEDVIKESLNESYIVGYDSFMEHVYEAFNTKAVEDYVSSKSEPEVKEKPTAVTPTTNRNKSTDKPDDVKAFQDWVIGTKKDAAILGSYGADGKWGSNTANAWAKYGTEYKNNRTSAIGNAAADAAKDAMGKLTYSADQYKYMANKLDKAMRGLGTTEWMVSAQFKKMKTKADVIALGKAFGIRDGQNLIEWLAGDGVLALAIRILASKGIKINMSKLGMAGTALKGSMKDYANLAVKVAKKSVDPFGLIF